MQVRDLPADHDPTDRLAAMREAMDDATPALGLYFREERPTLGDALDGLVEKAGGELPGKSAPSRRAKQQDAESQSPRYGGFVRRWCAFRR